MSILHRVKYKAELAYCAWHKGRNVLGLENVGSVRGIISNGAVGGHIPGTL